MMLSHACLCRGLRCGENSSVLFECFVIVCATHPRMHSLNLHMQVTNRAWLCGVWPHAAGRGRQQGRAEVAQPLSTGAREQVITQIQACCALLRSARDRLTMCLDCSGRRHRIMGSRAAPLVELEIASPGHEAVARALDS